MPGACSELLGAELLLVVTEVTVVFVPSRGTRPTALGWRVLGTSELLAAELLVAEVAVTFVPSRGPACAASLRPASIGGRRQLEM